MKNENGFSLWEEVKLDYVFSWKLLKQNYKAFFLTEIFAIGITIFFVISLALVLTFSNIKLNTLDQTIIGIIFIAFVFSYNIFISCQYGLAYDIFSSGNMYAEFRGSFKYFRHYWWQYLIIGILKSLFNLPNSFNLIWFFDFFVQIFILMMYPSITDKGLIFISIKDSLFIYMKNIKRIVLSLGIFYFLFNFPQTMILLLFANLHINFLIPNRFNNVTYLIAVYNITIYLLTYPLLTLLLTRIYNTSDKTKDNSTGED